MGNIYHTVDENASFLAVFFTAFFSLLNSSRSETEAIRAALKNGAPRSPESNRCIWQGWLSTRYFV